MFTNMGSREDPGSTRAPSNRWKTMHVTWRCHDLQPWHLKILKATRLWKVGVQHSQVSYMGMDQYLLIPFLGEWTSIYQLFWCSPGVQGFDTLPYPARYNPDVSPFPSPVAVTLSFVHNFGESMWHFSSQGNCHSWRPLKNGFGKYWEHIFWWHYMAIFGLTMVRLQAIAQGGGPQFPPPNVRSVLAAPEICVSSCCVPPPFVTLHRQREELQHSAKKQPRSVGWHLGNCF